MSGRAAFEADYVVVGGGAAGCVVAARLAENPSVRVLLLEAGGPDRALQLRIPAANVASGSDPRFNWSYRTEPVPELEGRRLYWAQGRVLGGSGSINGMMYLRGHPADYDRWAAEGAAGWDHAGVLPYFRKAETNERGESALHGGSGPLRVAAGRGTAPVCDLFVEAAAAAGLTPTDDLNRGSGPAAGHVDMTIGRGLRSSTSAAYLRPALARGNIRVLTGALATRVLIGAGEARGVEFRHRGGTRRAMAGRAVILSGGAVNSPQLLMLSGIGPASHLREHGIPVAADLPGVGANLQNHPMYRMVYGITAPLSAYGHLRPLGLARAGAAYLAGRRGVLSRGLFPTAAFFPADGDDPGSEIQICLAPAPVVRRGPGIRGILPAEHGFTLLVNHGSPYSRGEVRLASADPAAPAAIRPNYFSDPRDIGILARGALRAQEIVHAAPLGPILGRRIEPAARLASQREAEADIRRSAATHYHAAGTCRMGTDAGAVVDPALRVRGIGRLHVIDASVMPVLVNGNTYAATIMIAEKGTDQVKAAQS